MHYFNYEAQKQLLIKEECQLIKYLMVKSIKMEKIKVKQLKSSIKRIKSQKRTLEALGLKGIGKEVIHDASPSILGMIKKVEHLVSVVEA